MNRELPAAQSEADNDARQATRPRRRWHVAGIAAGVALLLYVGTYLVLRASWSEVWERNHHTYMLFPKNGIVLYYLFRPLSYVDGALTGMRFHIGPHQ